MKSCFFIVLIWLYCFTSAKTHPRQKKDSPLTDLDSAVKLVPGEPQYKITGSKFILKCELLEILLEDEESNDEDESYLKIKWRGPDKRIISESNERVFSSRVNTLRSNMYIRSLEKKDEGLYTCEVERKDGSVFMASNTLFLSSEISFVEGPSKVEGLEGKSVLIPCEATGSPQPDIYWKFEYKKINIKKDKRYDVTRKGLLISDVRISDNGSYECNAQVISEGRFKIKRINLEVYYPPKMSSGPQSKTVVRGSDVSFKCAAVANPSPNFQWFKENSNGNKKLLHSENGYFEIKHVLPSDQGKYICVARNKHGIDTTTAALSVAVPPILSLTKGPVKVLEGTDLVLSCKASGSPVSSFQWRKSSIDKESQQNFYHKNFQSFPVESSRNKTPIHQTSTTSLSGLHRTHRSNEGDSELNGAKNNLYDQELLTSSGRISIRTNAKGDESRLAIIGVTKDDKSTYSCQASNMAGADTKLVDVNVHYRPKAKIQQNKLIYGWTGQKRTITCNVVGLPVPNVIWTRGKGKNSVLMSTSHHRITRQRTSNDSVTSSLHLLLDQEFEFGMYNSYSCIAKNQYGHSADTFQLRRAYVPYQPRNISLLNVTDRSFVLKTRFGSSKPILSAQNSYSSNFYFNNYMLPIESWIVKYKKTSQPPDENEKFSVKKFENDHFLEVGGLHDNTEYHVLVYAVNQVGSSDPAKFNVKTEESKNAFVDDELPQSDQVRMLFRSSMLNKQSSFNRNHRSKSSYWSGMSVGVTILLAGILTILATVGIALAIKNRRSQDNLFRGIELATKKDSRNDVGDEIDNLTLKTNRKLSSIGEGSPFVNRYNCETMPKSLSHGMRMTGTMVKKSKNEDEYENKKMWPMSSTLPRSTKLDIHVNRTASIMEMIEEDKKTKQSQAWKEMIKIANECKEDEDEDSLMKSDISYESTNDDTQNNNFSNNILKCQAANLPPPPNEMLTLNMPTIHQNPFIPVHQNPQSLPIRPPPRMAVQAPSTQMPFDPSPMKDNDEDDISFIDDDDDEDDDVVITDHSAINNSGYNTNYYNNNRFYPIQNNNYKGFNQY